MSIEDIITVEGKPGLYKIIAKTKNGLIAESLEDKKRIPVFASSNVSAFKDISIYTKEDSCPIKEVFKKISAKEDGNRSIDPNSNPEELKAYFKIVLPEYDEDQVYISHIKKVLKWYNQLNDLKLLDELLKDSDKGEKEEEKLGIDAKAQNDLKKNVPKTSKVKANSKAMGGIKNTTNRKAS